VSNIRAHRADYSVVNYSVSRILKLELKLTVEYLQYHHNRDEKFQNEENLKNIKNMLK